MRLSPFYWAVVALTLLSAFVIPVQAEFGFAAIGIWAALQWARRR